VTSEAGLDARLGPPEAGERDVLGPPEAPADELLADLDSYLCEDDGARLDDALLEAEAGSYTARFRELRPSHIAATVWQFHGEQARAWADARRTKVIVAGRRWGKSEFLVRWILHGAHEDAVAGIPGVSWVVLPTFQMARPIWRKFLRLAPPGWVDRAVGTETSPDYLSLGPARIEFKSGDHPERLVGEGLARVAVDEAGIIKEQVWAESILPALIDSRAPALLGGTPKGRTWFYRMFARGLDPADPDVATFGGPSWQNPFIDAAEVWRLRGEMPDRHFRQEILAEFLSDEGAVFRGVRECVGSFSKEPTVVIGVDLARKADYTVLVGLDARMRVTFLDRFGNVPWPLQKERIAARGREGGRRPLLVVDATGVGDPVAQDLQRAGLRVRPFVFTPASKAMLVDSLVLAIEQRQVTLPDDPVLLNELEAFEFEETKAGNIRYSAPDGLHDDVVMALGLAVLGGRRAGDTGVSVGPLPARPEAGGFLVEGVPADRVEPPVVERGEGFPRRRV
jgi:hypothetical protein